MPAELSTASRPFGDLLRGWRRARKLSQLNMALEAGVSQRHVSFLESGRAQPSREMVLQLAGALDVPLRERNVLLQTAGFAPLYRERGLDSADMAAVRHALQMMLDHHEPLPAVVINRGWELVLANAAAQRFLGAFTPNGLAKPAMPTKPDANGDESSSVSSRAASGSAADRQAGRETALNLMRFTFHHRGLQPLVANWEEVGPLLLSRLQREVAADPANSLLRELYEEILEYPAVAPAWRNTVWPATPPPILHLEVRVGDVALKLFTMISTFGTAQDVTAEELRVESFFAADEATTAFFTALAAGV